MTAKQSTVEYKMCRLWHYPVFPFLESLPILLLLLLIVQTASAQNTLNLKAITSNLEDASALSVAPTGSVFIVETNKNRILVVNTAGQRVDSLGNFGFGDYQFDEPIDVDATNGLKIYVSDNGNNRIQIFDRHLQYLSSIADASNNPLTNTYYPTQLCVDNRGDLFFYDDRSHYVFSFDHYGKFNQGFNTQALGAIHEPSDMICYGDRLYMADPTDRVIHILSLGGGYLGFMAHAGQVQGIATVGTGIWAVSSDTLLSFDMRGRLLMTQKLDVPDNPVGISILGDTIYILTPSELLKGRVPALKE